MLDPRGCPFAVPGDVQDIDVVESDPVVDDVPREGARDVDVEVGASDFLYREEGADLASGCEVGREAEGALRTEDVLARPQGVVLGLVLDEAVVGREARARAVEGLPSLRRPAAGLETHALGGAEGGLVDAVLAAGDDLPEGEGDHVLASTRSEATQSHAAFSCSLGRSLNPAAFR